MYTVGRVTTVTTHAEKVIYCHGTDLFSANVYIMTVKTVYEQFILPDLQYSTHDHHVNVVLFLRHSL